MTDTIHLLGRNSTPIGVLSKPPVTGPFNDVAVVFLNSGLLHRVGPFRLYVSLARQFVENGIPVLRIDQSGKGDSERRKGLSFIDSVKKDFEDAAAFLEGAVGAKRFIVLGLCSGADDALYLASEYPQIAGAVLLEAYAFRTPRYYLQHYGPRLVRLDLWSIWTGRALRFLLSKARSLAGRRGGEQGDIGAIREFVGSDEMRRRYRSVVKRGGKLLCVFTDGARSYYNYEGQLVECLNLQKADQLISELYIPGAKHTYPLVSHRERLMEEVCKWATREFGSSERALELDYPRAVQSR